LNIREGMRRVGVLLGCIGLCFGIVGCVLVFQDTWQTRTRHAEFERLAHSDVVMREQRYLWSLHLSPDAVPASTDVGRLPAGVVITPFPVKASDSEFTVDSVQIPGNAVIGSSPPNTTSSPSESNSPKVIHWTNDLAVSSIERMDGETFYGMANTSLCYISSRYRFHSWDF